MVKRAGAAALIGATALIAPALAPAHPEIAPAQVNRYVTLVAVDDRLQAYLVLLYGAIPAAALRRELDTNGDGALDPAERSAAAPRFAARATDWLGLSIDDGPARLTFECGIELGGDARVSASPVVVELYGAVPLAGPGHRLRVEPRQDPPAAGETEIAIETLPPWRLAASAAGAAPLDAAAPLPLFKWTADAPRDARGATFVVAGGAGLVRRPPAWLYAVGPGVAALTLAAFLIARGRRARLSAARSATAGSSPPTAGTSPT